ncbi:hypothetical protein [Metabacillus iocasae]|uniref:Uncharacterized protein n=1 Tax=Priestia iocasae TaxID=2291674 RepID=A0ABS2QY87_9BACI|nr:hypothetical protein [Metabacillus iocasae]MBM7703942.1 hypothetical protein [Metabacillus iocasae]
MYRKLVVALIIVFVFIASSGYLTLMNDRSPALQASAVSIPITIGMVGSDSHVAVDEVTIKHLSLDELIQLNHLSMDAILITPEQINEAAKPKYAQFFAKVEIPVFFIGVNQPYYTNSDQSLVYSNQPYKSDVTYAYGRVKQSASKFKTWGFKAENENEMLQMYKDIFQTVRKHKNQTSSL